MIYYSILDDFDDPEQPNAFGISKSVADITLKDIKQAFPLEGTYHFRFKYLHNKIPVWMDLNNDDAHIPLFSGKVIAKVTRISWEASAPTPKATPPRQSPVASQSSQLHPTQPPQAPQPPAKRSMDIFDSHDSRGASAPSTTSGPASSDFDLLFSH